MRDKREMIQNGTKNPLPPPLTVDTVVEGTFEAAQLATLVVRQSIAVSRMHRLLKSRHVRLEACKCIPLERLLLFYCL
jgi:hypothetical protein